MLQQDGLKAIYSFVREKSKEKGWIQEKWDDKVHLRTLKRAVVQKLNELRDTQKLNKSTGILKKL